MTDLSPDGRDTSLADVSMANLVQLVQMGFSEEQSGAALAQVNGNVDEAISILLGGASSPSPAAHDAGTPLQELSQPRGAAFRQQPPEWRSLVEGDTSQYGFKAVSACTVMCCDMASLLLGSQAGADLSDPSAGLLITQVLRSGAEFKSAYHLEADEVLQSCHRFAALEPTELLQLPTGRFGEMLDRMVALRVSRNGPVCALVVRPPETVLLHLSGAGNFALFDSHRREHHDGAALVTFNGQPQLVAYLEWLFAPRPGSPTHGQAMDVFEASLLVSRQGWTAGNVSELEELLHRAELRALGLEKEVQGGKVFQEEAVQSRKEKERQRQVTAEAGLEQAKLLQENMALQDQVAALQAQLSRFVSPYATGGTPYYHQRQDGAPPLDRAFGRPRVAMEDGTANHNNDEAQGMSMRASDTPSRTRGVFSGAPNVGLQWHDYECAGMNHMPADLPVDRRHGQFADFEVSLKNGMVGLSSALDGIATTSREPSNPTRFSAETGDIVASTTRALGEGLRKINCEEALWTPQALTGRLQALRSQMCHELSSLGTEAEVVMPAAVDPPPLHNKSTKVNTGFSPAKSTASSAATIACADGRDCSQLLQGPEPAPQLVVNKLNRLLMSSSAQENNRNLLLKQHKKRNGAPPLSPSDRGTPAALDGLVDEQADLDEVVDMLLCNDAELDYATLVVRDMMMEEDSNGSD